MVLSLLSIYGQENEEDYILPTHHIIYQEVNEILQAIIATQPAISGELQLKIMKKEIKTVYTAAYNIKKQHILFHERVYNFCKQQYPNNYKSFIAFILGHELKHHYQKENGSDRKSVV